MTAARWCSAPPSLLSPRSISGPSVSRVTLFWAAFILTRPLGATVGDFLDKPHSHGGLALSRPLASVVLMAFIIGCVLVLPQRAGAHPRVRQAAGSARGV